MTNKGFTLLELLAIIVLLAVIAIITVPVVIGVINDARKKAFTDSAYNLVKAAQTYQTVNGGEIEVKINYTNGNPSLDIGKFKGDLPDSGTFILDSNGKSEMKIWRDDLKVCAVKEKNSKKIEISETITTKEACKL